MLFSLRQSEWKILKNLSRNFIVPRFLLGGNGRGERGCPLEPEETSLEIGRL
jgi:hypothetical protein